MTGIELIDGIVKLIKYFIDIFSAILNFPLKPILNNPSNFGNEPSVYLGNLAVSIYLLISYFLILFIIYYGVRLLVSNILNEKSLIKESICLSLTTETIGLYFIPNNFTFIRILGDIIGLCVIIYIILFILTFIAEKFKHPLYSK